MKKLFTLLLTVILCNSSFAQSSLITAAGDTLVGNISFYENMDGNVYANIKHKNGKDAFGPLEIKQILNFEGSTIEPILVNSKYTFGMLDIKGYMSKYRFTPENSREKFQEIILIKNDGNTLVVPHSFGFKRTMVNFTEECPVVSSAVAGKEYKRGDIDNIVNAFNECIGKGQVQEISTTQEVASLLETSNLNELDQKKISDFKTLLNYSNKLSNKEDAIEMFDDIVKRLSEGKTIPNYLKNAFRNTIADDETLVKLYNEIVKN